MSPVLLVPKKDGSMRFCVDFRKVNAITVRPAASIPSAEDIFYALGKSKFRTSLDMKQGFGKFHLGKKTKRKLLLGQTQGSLSSTRWRSAWRESPRFFKIA